MKLLILFLLMTAITALALFATPAKPRAGIEAAE
jgi:hypothetical protein